MLDIKKVGLNILNLRKERGMTQTELAESLNISHQAISKWERGECLPDLELLVQLSRMFNIKVDEILFSAEPNNFKEEPKELNEYNPWDKMLQMIQVQISKPSFDTWFKPTRAEYDGESLKIYANQFTAAWFENRYSAIIRNSLEQVVREPSIKIEFQSV